MTKTIKNICFAMCLMPSVAAAQVFQDVTMEKFASEQETRMAGISRDGRYAFTTSLTRKGLVRIDLNNHQQQVISTELGAGIDPVISHDGNSVMHNVDTFDELHRRHSERKAALLPAAPQRVSVSVNTDLRIELTIDGESRTLAPNGDDEETNYIWASLSPDGQRILYFVSDQGAYVCNLEGEDLQFISSDCQAPQWYDDQTIVGMRTRDNGEFILESTLVAYTLKGDRQQLTEPSLMLMYPYCSAQAGRIVSTNPEGEMYILNVKH